MKRTFQRAFLLSVALCWTTFFLPVVAQARQAEGEKLFKQSCTACHTINKGKLIGPDLANINKRRPEQWIVSFIKSSQTVINSGDPYAAKLYENFDEIMMPDYNFSDAQVQKITNYIAANSLDDKTGNDTVLSDSQAETLTPPATEETIQSGRMLFIGEKRFVSNGPACNACHNVDRQGILAGGALAKDLTNVHSRLRSEGIKSIISHAPFPVMQKAYDGKALTDQETLDLVAFLQTVDNDKNSKSGPYHGARLFFSGLGGAAILLGLFAGVRTRNKKKCVNHEIYQRQVKSTWEDTDEKERKG